MATAVRIDARTGQTQVVTVDNPAPNLPKPDPKALQILAEMQAREAEGRAPTLTAFIAAMTPAEQLMFAASSIIPRADRRIAQFGAAFGMSSQEIEQFLDDAAARETTET